MLNRASTHFRLRSFVRRSGRKTVAQETARKTLWPQFGLPLTEDKLHLDQVFGRQAPRFLEIGFGSGQSLLAIAKAKPQFDFIGVETHQPGIGALLHGMQLHELRNIRVFDADVIDVLEKCIPDESLHGVQIFFPDPWQKRRHHARRLVQKAFVAMLYQKLIFQGTLHLATDWEDYAKHMLQVMQASSGFTNLAGDQKWGERSCYRPVATKFERRAMAAGRAIWELQFAKST
jgi:tRNA (guanine-N7-)-methyltransferase